MAATLRVVDLNDDWTDDDTGPVAGTAAAAEAVAAEPETGPTVHGRARARVHAKSSLLLLSLFWAVLRDEAADLTRAGEGSETPWEAQPPSLSGLHGQVMNRAGIFATFPAARVAYLVAGHLVLLPCAASYWLAWAVFGSPGRLFLSVLICIVLQVTGILPTVIGI